MSANEENQTSSTSSIDESSKPTNDESSSEEKGANHISLRVVSSNGEEVFFKIRQTTPMSKLMAVYCQRKQMSPSSIKFLFDGSRISDDATPKSLGMEENDVIDAMLQQTGGY